MAATKTFPALTTIAETFGPGKLRILDKSTIDIFDEAMILAADTIMPGRNRGVALVMSPAEWNALPENIWVMATSDPNHFGLRTFPIGPFL